MNWDLRDWLSVSVQFLTLAVTFYFTLQLVKNDNSRERRVEEGKWIRRYESVLARAAGSGPGVLQLVGKQILNRNPNHEDLMFEAYLEVALEYEHKVPSMTEFRQLLLDYGVSLKSKESSQRNSMLKRFQGIFNFQK